MYKFKNVALYSWQISSQQQEINFHLTPFLEIVEILFSVPGNAWKWRIHSLNINLQSPGLVFHSIADSYWARSDPAAPVEWKIGRVIEFWRTFLWAFEHHKIKWRLLSKWSRQEIRPRLLWFDSVNRSFYLNGEKGRNLQFIAVLHSLALFIVRKVYTYTYVVVLLSRRRYYGLEWY